MSKVAGVPRTGWVPEKGGLKYQGQGDEVPRTGGWSTMDRGLDHVQKTGVPRTWGWGPTDRGLESHGQGAGVPRTGGWSTKDRGLEYQGQGPRARGLKTKR